MERSAPRRRNSLSIASGREGKSSSNALNVGPWAFKSGIVDEADAATEADGSEAVADALDSELVDNWRWPG